MSILEVRTLFFSFLVAIAAIVFSALPGSAEETGIEEAAIDEIAAEVAELSEAEAKEQARLDRVRCKSPRSTGSRLRKKKICMTNREWDAMARASQNALHRGQSSGGVRQDTN